VQKDQRKYFRNLLLHFRPSTVPERTLRLSLTWGLGGMAVVLVFLLIGTGLLLKFIYEPVPGRAYESILYLENQVQKKRIPGLSSAVVLDGNVVYIGACTGAKLDDLRMAASVLKGRKLAADVELLVAPASRQDQDIAEAEGLMAVFEEAGARVLANACGICAGYGTERLGEEVTCISSTARNFRGRMGAASSKVYLASPFTVAASAIAGHLADPREIIADGGAS